MTLDLVWIWKSLFIIGSAKVSYCWYHLGLFIYFVFRSCDRFGFHVIYSILLLTTKFVSSELYHVSEVWIILIFLNSALSVLLNCFILYQLRVCEILMGNESFFSVLVSNVLIYLPIKYGLFQSSCFAQGSFFITGSLLACYWSMISLWYCWIELIPCNESDNIHITSSSRLSRKILLLFILLVNGLLSGRWGIVECLLGLFVGWLINPSLCISFPSFLCDWVCVWIVFSLHCSKYLISSTVSHHPVILLLTIHHRFLLILLLLLLPHNHLMKRFMWVKRMWLNWW